MIDFVFPEGNEQKFIQTAKRLGYSEICFVYSMKDFKKTQGDIKIYTAIAESEKFDKAKQRADFVITKAADNARAAVESCLGLTLNMKLLMKIKQYQPNPMSG